MIYLLTFNTLIELSPKAIDINLYLGYTIDSFPQLKGEKMMQKIILFIIITLIAVLVVSTAGWSSINEKSPFNSDSRDPSLEGYSSYYDPKEWHSWLIAHPGDILEFSSYYHNCGNVSIDNTKITLSLIPDETSGWLKVLSKISADGFNDCETGNLSVSTTISNNIALRDQAAWYHHYSTNEGWIKTILPVDVVNDQAVVNLGRIDPGYTPNDGYVVFYADVS